MTTNKQHHTDSFIYTVNLHKREHDGFGFLIRQRDSRPYFSIWEIIKNGAAEKCGKIRRGDIIICVNNQDLANASYEHGLEILKAVQPGSMAEFVFKTGLKHEVDLIAKHEKALIAHQNNLHSSLAGGLMSPLQKIKKKFVSCASGEADMTSNTLAAAGSPSFYDSPSRLSLINHSVKSSTFSEASVKADSTKAATNGGQSDVIMRTSCANQAASDATESAAINSPIFKKVDRYVDSKTADNKEVMSPNVAKRQHVVQVNNHMIGSIQTPSPSPLQQQHIFNLQKPFVLLKDATTSSSKRSTDNGAKSPLTSWKISSSFNSGKTY